MVSVSPRLRDSLDYEEPDTIDPRLSLGFSSISLDSSGYEEYELHDDRRPYSASGDPSSSRRKRRQRESDQAFDQLAPFEYRTVADGDLFRLAVVLPGTAKQSIECRLIWEHSKKPQRDYVCLSYCWETVEREADIIVEGSKFPVTFNLLAALRALRKTTTNLLIWIDQICINQDDPEERAHQVWSMQNIYSFSKKVVVWLGEEDDKTRKLCDYAKKMRRGDDSSKIRNTLNKTMSPRELQAAIQNILQRPYFQRVWVIPEVALSRFTTIAIGPHRITWDNLVRLIKDVPLPPAQGFDKQLALLGNPRQRIAILTQMIATQRERLAHTDIMQLLILAKGSKATDVRDMIYSFYALTYLRTFPDYRVSVEKLYTEIAHYYANSILWDTSYSAQHDLSEEKRTQQLMSILYSAGKLHQHCNLPSWIPDWTFSWYLSPIWCKTTSNFVTGSGKDEWSIGIRSDFRAGGPVRGDFEVLDGPHGAHKLRVSAMVFDTIKIIGATPASSPGPVKDSISPPDSSMKYGRTFFKTRKGVVGVATPGVEANDSLAVILGGDVPVVLRSHGGEIEESRDYQLLCECFVQNDGIMSGELARTNWVSAEDIVLI
ncbi:hypothetical protein LTR37_020018 [Vermiconidia calcicola]|uniref:Uncharacterized protein n=1 Tax=Vermiconidia calcicola TaxID=1690605 RepID=A0ACC3MCE3_9PEZI|nr:hypothetical protein LTR37_020018 [Vermiconidia calcicola]